MKFLYVYTSCYVAKSSPWALIRVTLERMISEVGFGGGSIRNVVAMQVPIALVNDLFISHLHVDHYADLPLMYAFRAYLGGFTPLRIYGPSGRTPELKVSFRCSATKK